MSLVPSDVVHGRTIAQVREIMLERARERRNPFVYTEASEVAAVFDQLHSLDRDAWGEAFVRAAEPHEAAAARAAAAGNTAAARDEYLAAYNYCQVGRYPAPNSPGKQRAYRRGLQNYFSAWRYLDDPPVRVEMPFAGRPGEGSVSVGYLRRPRDVARPPVLITWGGIDTFKEERERAADPYLAVGLAVLCIDMPGVGEAPLAGSEDAERLWDAVLDWVAAQPDLNAEAVGVLGLSTGGYWATKLAHTHRDRLRAAVNHGGCAHHAFTAEWIARAQCGEYPFELAETLASAFGRSTYADWLEYAPRLSLLNQGVLDQPCAPLLCVNGLDDSIFPIQDMYVLLEHGEPKSVRLFPGGHMGMTPRTIPTIVHFLQQHLT